jgi:hypothetical protein
MATARLVVLLSLCVCIVFVSSGPAQVIVQQKKTVAFIFGQIRPSTFSGTPVLGPNGRPIVVDAAIGTAFFISYPDNRGGENFSFYYVVTAKHVLGDGANRFLPDVALRLNLKDRSQLQSYDFVRLPVIDEQGNLLWMDDPDNPSSDVAILPFLPDLNKFDFLAIGTDLFLTNETAKKEHFSEGDSLYFVGLLPQYYGEKMNYPVVRKGSVALITDEPIDTPTGKQNAYIAEITAWPGNSGSPVFVNLAGTREGALRLGESFALIGILQGYYFNKQNVLVTETARMLAGDDSNIGISFVVPADTLLKVLKSAKAQRLRDDELRRRGLIK